MNRTPKYPRFLKLLSALLILTTSVRAQIPPPEPLLPSAPVRQKLRAAILEIAASSNANVENIRPDLALPLAQLGDWDAALRLLRSDLNAAWRSDELWQWRAYQLAQAGKWRAVPAIAAHIQRRDVRFVRRSKGH